MRSSITQTSRTASLAFLAVALTVCLTVVVFSWPDRHDRKRAVAPKLMECCDVKIANTTLFSRRSAVPDAAAGEAKVVPASLR